MVYTLGSEGGGEEEEEEKEERGEMRVYVYVTGFLTPHPPSPPSHVMMYGSEVSRTQMDP